MVRSSPESCAVCRRRAGGAPCGLGARVGERLGRNRASHVFRRGQPVFYAGAPAHALFVIRSGRVKVYRQSVGGEEQVLRLLGPGELIGYRPLLAEELYGASAEAVEDSAICVIPAETVRQLLREVPELALDLLRKLAVELRLSEELMMDLVHRPVRERAARMLLSLLHDNRNGAEPRRLHSRHLRRQDMARMIGTTPETYSRVLRGFAQRGVITLTREHIEIRDPRQLEKIAGASISA